MPGGDARVGELVRALCARHVAVGVGVGKDGGGVGKDGGGGSGGGDDARVEGAARVAARLLASALRAAPSLRDSDTVVRAVITRLVRDGRHPDATRYAQLAAGLKFEPGVSDSAAWAVLYLLAALRDSDNPDAQGGDLFAAASAAGKEAAGRGSAAAGAAGRAAQQHTQTPAVFVAPPRDQRDDHTKLGGQDVEMGKGSRSDHADNSADDGGAGNKECNDPDDDDNNDDDDDDDEDDDDDAEDYYDADGRATAAALRGSAKQRLRDTHGRDGVILGPQDPPFTPAHRRAVLSRRPARPQADASASVTPRAVEILLVRDVMLVVQGENGTYVRFPPVSDARDDLDEDLDEGLLAARGLGMNAVGDGEISAVDRQRGVRELRRRIAQDKLAVEIAPFSSSDMVMSPSSVHLVRYIAELGFLFNVIRRRMRSIDNIPGLVATNFCNAIEREMEAYYRSLAAFQSGAGGPAPSANSSQSGSGDTAPSLRTVYVWAEGEKPRLRWLARLCEETEGLVGGQTLAHLRSYRRSYVAEDIRGLLSRIIARTAAPLDLMLIRWITEGVLIDPNGEFYIMEDPKVAAAAEAATRAMNAKHGGADGGEGGVIGATHAIDGLAGGPNAASAASHRIWWGLFKVRRDMIPGVQSRTVVEDTLTAGKSIAFLRRCCGDSAWVDQVHAPAMAAYLAENASSYVAPEDSAQMSGRGLAIGAGLLDQDPRVGKDHVAELVRMAVRSASLRLKTLFFEKFDLSHHFAAIKNYLLLSQGDFTQALMDSLAPLLDGDGRILRNNITGLLDTALRTCSSFNPATDADIAERLDVQILPQASDDSVGWDVFSLTYRVEDAPLNTVFSTKVMDAYLQIFRFLWRLKRMDYVLSTAYLELRELDSAWRQRQRRRRRPLGQPGAGAAGKGFGEARVEKGVVVEQQQQQEQDELAASEDEAATIYANVVNRAHFLRMKMTHLLQNMQYYCTFEVLEGNWQVLSEGMSRAEDIDSLIRAHARYLAAIKDRTLLSERSRHVARSLDAVLATILSFRTLQREICAPPGLAAAPSAASASGAAALDDKLRGLESRFDEVFTAFLADLSAHAQTVGSCVFLVFRLDYNSYYGRTRAAGPAAPLAGAVAAAEGSG